ncbi:MAG: fibronectin type III domain-containing protein [Candidatus Anstonellales archaeon]
MEMAEENFVDRLKGDRLAGLLALLALLLIIFGVFAVLGGAGVVTMSPPTNLQATVIYPNVKLTWDHSVDYPDPCIGYNVYWSTTRGQLGILQNAEPIADTKYTIKNVKPGTYYATARCVDNAGNEDGNLNQLEVKVELQPPSGLSIVINDGAEYTNKRDVTLALSATNAEECTNANENMDWSPWGPYTVEKEWKLTENAGGCEEKTVYYKCRNAGGESSPVSDTIILDTLPPSVSFNVLSAKDNKLTIQIFAQDDCVPDVDCYVFAGNQQIGSIQNLAGQAERTYEVPYGTYFLAVACTDGAGNSGSAALEVNVKQPENATNKTEISIKINNDAATTTSLDVTLNLYCRINGKTPDAVYYSSGEMGEVGPESYTTSRTWKLDNKAPEHTRTYTVCYRCEKDDVTARACDSIRYVVEEEGGGGGGDGGGDGQVPPKNLKAEIIGYRTHIGTGWHLPVPIPDTEVTKGSGETGGVYLSLSSSGATECKVWNEKIEGVDTGDDEESDVEWSSDLVNNPRYPWELIPSMIVPVEPEPGGDEFRPKAFIIIVGDGNRTINYKCKNNAGTTGPIKDSIWYDATKPSPVGSLSAEMIGEAGIGMVIMKLTWEPSVDNSWNWEGYTHKGIQLYSVCRTYTLQNDPTKSEHDLGCKDYTPAEIGCEEENGHFALECALTSIESLPLDLRTQGGKMCYNVSAWDYAGWRSSPERVCVDIPPSGPIDKVPEIIWVAIYEGVGGIGEGGGEELQAKESTSKVEKIVGSVSSQNPTSVILLAQPAYEGGVPLSPPPGESGDMYTRIANVRVRVMAVNAEKCMLGNDGPGGGQPVWSGTWIDYNGDPTTYTWTLRDVEGERTVFVKCKNNFGESAIASDSIIYDHTPPEVVGTDWKANYIETCEKNWIYVAWSGVFNDAISGIKQYTVREYTRYLIGGGGKGGPAYNWTETGNWTTQDTFLYDYNFVKDTTYKYTITACDNAGNCNNVGVTTDPVTPTKDPYNVPCE